MYPCSSFKAKETKKSLYDIYEILYSSFGSQGWWPADSRFETIVGAILTQSVSWTNVEKAIDNLKEYCRTLGMDLSPEMLKEINIELLAELIRPSGYYNMKAKKLKAFVDFLYQEYKGNLAFMFKENLEVLRPRLLKVYGIGPETADSILLYAGNYPIFVIDAYTKRVFSRIGLTTKDVDYHSLQEMVMGNYSPDVKKYNEYHALIVELGKNICKKRNPDCKNCILANNYQDVS